MASGAPLFHACCNAKVRRIDVHHHYFTSDLKKEQANVKLGWKTPEENLPWSPQVSLRAMNAMNIDVAVLSFPPLASGRIGEDNRALTRKRNEYAAATCAEYPDRFRFFGCLPFLNDVEGCLEELTHVLDKLHACGVSLASCYGIGADTKYVGHESYHRVWAELNKRKTVVFLHGAQIPSSVAYPHEFLGVPITEPPNETFKAAAHLVITHHRRVFPDVRIILAHLGGTTPFLASRVAVLSHHMGCTLNPDEILEDFKSFYYETALSAYEPNLVAMEKFVKHDHLLFGSDFPAVSETMANWYTTNLEEFYKDQDEKLDGIMRDNAIKLFLGS